MNNPPLPHNESERLRALHEYEILDTEIEEDFDRITTIASLVCGAPISLISLIDKDRQWFKSRVGLDVQETSRNLAFCRYVITGDNFLEVYDATEDERFKENELVTADPHIRYYAGFPLIDPNGYALGTLCVIDTIPRMLNDDQKKALSLLRDEAMALIVNRKEKESYKESEQKLKAFFDNSQGLMCTHDLEGNMLTVNDAGAAILGYSRSEIENMSLFDIIPQEAHQNLIGYLHEIVQKGTVKGEMRTATKSGELRIWLFNNILQNKGEKNPYIIGNAVDVTEQHYLEKDLKQTQAMLARTGRVARIGGWEYSLLSKELSWSEITKEIHEVPTNYQPDIDKALEFYKANESREKILEAIQKAISKGESWDLELEIITFKGVELWVRALGYAEFEQGTCIRIYGTFQDIDKRKRIEAESAKSKKLLEDVLEATSAVGIISTDTQGIITLFNKGAENILGYHSEEIIGKLSPVIFHKEGEIVSRAKELEEELGFEVKGFRALVEKPEIYGAEQREWTYIRKDGSSLYVSLAVTAIRDIAGIIIGYLCIATDISKIINQREELERAKLLAEQANIAKSEFLANMSHEIRTPLNGIIGFTDLMTRTELDHTQKGYLAIVDQSANLLLSIINDILDFSKIEAGKLELDIERSELYELLEQVTSFLNFQMESKKLELNLNVSPDVPHYVWIDSLRIKQVLMNLLSNATKFTEKGTIELSVEVLFHDDQFSTLRFGVRDTGIGIKVDKQEKIFDAFSQEDTSTTKRYGGTGLGLTISNKLLNMMGSKLQLESTYGVGSLFFFDITLRSLEGESQDWKNLDQIKNVLVVDSDQASRLTLVQKLKLKQINVFQANNGFEVLQLLMAGNRYDVIIIDDKIPIMGGIETIKKIREKLIYSDLDQPIILVFDDFKDDIGKICKELDLHHWMIKPILFENLFKTLSDVQLMAQSQGTTLLKKESVHKYNFKVLIVEDNEFNMLLTATLVRNILPNAEILEAVDGFMGLKLFKENHIDLILMDIQMPEMNGYEVTQEIRNQETGIQIPIIALTAGNVKGEKDKCLAVGMNDFVVKPVIEQTLREIIGKWLKQ